MPAVAPGWEFKVQRGPGWLFVKIASPLPDPASCGSLADQLRSLLQRHSVYRLILELDQVDLLNSYLLGQLVVVYRFVTEHNGMLRLCGLSNNNQRVLRIHRLQCHLPHYPDRTDALMGCHPKKPR